MPQALPLPLREQIVQLRRQGQTHAAVAAALHLKARSVRQIWARYRRAGPAGLTPDYDRCGHPGSRFPPALKEAALTLKREHPRWGAGFIRLHLADRFPGTEFPASRTLQQWFQAAGLQPARAQQPPVARDRARAAHEVWQMDAKERMHLGDGSGASTLAVTDEASGALLATVVFPPVSLEPGGRGADPSHPARYL
jgi:hypothetical protein